MITPSLRKRVGEPFYFDRPRPGRILLHLVRDEIYPWHKTFSVTSPRGSLIPICRKAGYAKMPQAGSHIILETSEPTHRSNPGPGPSSTSSRTFN